jgi:predicted dehydrogenase
MTQKSASKIHVGIVGVGNWARYGHIPALQLLPEYEITAVSSRRQETADAISKEFGFAHAFNDAQTLIHHPGGCAGKRPWKGLERD